MQYGNVHLTANCSHFTTASFAEPLQLCVHHVISPESNFHFQLAAGATKHGHRTIVFTTGFTKFRHESEMRCDRRPEVELKLGVHQKSRRFPNDKTLRPVPTPAVFDLFTKQAKNTCLNLARFLFTAASQFKGPIQPKQQRRCINCTQYTLATIGKIHTRLICRCVAGFTVQICTKAAKQTRFPVGP